MSAPRCFTFRDGNILVTEYQRMGTLLDLVNLTKNADKQIVEPIALYLTAELLGLMELVHSVKIVHADIKPDNFLVRHTPATKYVVIIIMSGCHYHSLILGPSPVYN